MDYTNFKKIDKEKLSSEEKKWLSEWELWDLACSPMDDYERRFIRYGHYMGWFAKKENSDVIT